MNNIVVRKNAVYPGEYTPHPGIESFLNKAQDLVVTGDHDARVNIDELEDCFKIQVAMPGLKVEDISIHVFNNILAIAAIHPENKIAGIKLKHREFNSDMLERYVVLPTHADPEFVSAQYQNGMLVIHMPKTKENNISVINEIIAY
ncbi:MAG: Hsp20/alpha crystallin family protein [Ferruginibacter sp.]